MVTRLITWRSLLILVIAGLCCIQSAHARTVEYQDSEVLVYVSPGEPTQINFSGKIAGGFKRRASSLSLDRKDSDLIIFGQDGLTEQGEAIIVRLEDGRSYSLRVKRANSDNPRDPVVKIVDKRRSILAPAEEQDSPFSKGRPDFAPSTQASGLMREMILVSEFGKSAVAGYRMSDRYQGQVVLNDGTIEATIDRIFIGPNLWGYVLDAQNLIDQTQRLNPATFRLDGTRAVSIQHWELAARPLNIEQQIAAKHKTKVYIVTKAR